VIRTNSTAVATNNYASAALYAPQGGLCALENGGYIISSLVYNNRLQPGRISASSSGSAPSTCPTSISGTGNVLDLSYNFNFGAGDNGNVMGIANNRNTARSETFTYDALNRVSSAWSNGNLWGEAYSIDPWGNLNQFGPYENSQNQILPFVEASQSLAANTQNQVSAFCYDTAGNVLAEAGSQCPPAQGSGFVYNAENQLTFAGGTNYVYDGDGNRVEKYMLNTQGQTVFQELYWYGGGSASLDETDGTGSTTDSAFNEYVFFNGARTAHRTAGGVYYYFADHLGTSREIVQSGSTTPCYDADFTPYGVEMPNTNTCAQNYKFTGKERDTESGLDNFDARYDASSMGRFMSPDPGNAGADYSDPQSWNAYAYVGNEPMNETDPDGMDPCPSGSNSDMCVTETALPSQSSGQSVTDGSYIALPPPSVLHEREPYYPLPRIKVDVTEPLCDAVCLMLFRFNVQLRQARLQYLQPQTDQLRLLAIEAAGQRAYHDLGCSGRAMAGMVPFAGYLVKNPKTSLGASHAGAVGEAQITASQSDKISGGLNAIEMPNIGELVAEYGPKAGNIAEQLAKPATAVGAVTAMAQANACFNTAP
jgi:RHS repeat-associated protein